MMEWNDMDAPDEQAEKNRARQHQRRKDAADDLYEALQAINLLCGSIVKRKSSKLAEKMWAALAKAEGR